MLTQKEQVVLAALESTDTFTGLLDATALPARDLDAALITLTRKGRIRRLPGARFRVVNLAHSRAVKRGQFVQNIPVMGEGS